MLESRCRLLYDFRFLQAMETVQGEPTPLGSPDSAAVLAELRKVLSSSQFRTSPRISRFLEYVVEHTIAGEANELKEYRIGMDVFERSDSYDPQKDPVVRVEAGRLRTRLASFYQTEGRDSGVRIDVPKGGYAAVFTMGSAFTDTTDSNPAPGSLHDSAETSSKKEVPSTPPRTARGKMLVFLLAGILAVAGWYAHSLLVSRRRAFENISVQKVTRHGKATLAAISPDGKYILSALNDNGLQSLWLRNLPSGSDVQIVPPERVRYRELQFSRDGNYLYFTRSEDRPTEAYLYRVPLLGGQPQRLITNVDSNISFSPDGKMLVFMVGNDLGDQYRLVTASVDGTAARDLATGPLSAVYPAWSPDGKTIVCATGPTDAALGSLLAIDVATGKQKLLFKSETARLSRPVWLPDGTGVLVLSSDQNSNFTEQQIALVSYPQGKLYPVTRDTNSYTYVDIANDGHTLVTVLGEAHWNLFVTQPGSDSEAQSRQLTADAPVRSFSWTRDDKLIIAQDSGLSLVDPASGSKFALIVPGTWIGGATVRLSRWTHRVRAHRPGKRPEHLAHGRQWWQPQSAHHRQVGSFSGLFCRWPIGLLRR